MDESQAKENADDLLQKKADMGKEQKELEVLGEQKDEALQKKLKSIGNYVHDSVPISDNEVGPSKSSSSVYAHV